VSGIGQSFNARRVMVLVVAADGLVHGWDVEPAVASWRMTGVSNGRTAVHIDIDGPMRRRTKDLPDADLVVPELEGRWEIEE
jgi:hypothetical protein